MKIVNLLNRVLKSQGQQLTKENEYMWWSPFVSHHKPKLQVNIKSGKWHCWVSGEGGHNLFQLFRKVNATKKHYTELKEFYEYCSNLGLNIIGTMCLPPINDDPEKYFLRMNFLNKKLNFKELSMGMSSDYMEAIKHNSTYLRIGTNIFGKRTI